MDHLKWINSSSSIGKARLTSVTNKQVVANKSWVAGCYLSTPGFSCNNLHNFHGFNRNHRLVTTSISDSLLHSQVFNPSNKLFKISLQLWIPCYQRLTTQPIKYWHSWGESFQPWVTLPRSPTLSFPPLTPETDIWNIDINLHPHFIE